MDTKLLHELKKLLGAEMVLHRPEELMMYEYDGSVELAKPNFVVFPQTREHVVGIVELANRHQCPLVGRGAGTGLSGGALARRGGIIVSFTRMNRILEVDTENQCAVVQPGVVNAELSAATVPLGLYYAPDPSSQKACTIGGNVAENSGGPHTLAYGVTANHVLSLEVVLPNGEVVRLGSRGLDSPGYDLLGLFVGSEGTLALVTEVTVKLLRLPEATKTLLAIFDTLDDTTETVAELTARGITPAACEMLDGWTLRAVEAYVHAGFPLDSAAVLLIDVDGVREIVEAQAVEVADVCRKHKAREVRVARDAKERDLLWKGRKNAFGAVGRFSPTYFVQDGVIPRTKLPQTIRRINEISEKYGYQIGNIFHAGDGNLHPLILFDARDEKQLREVIAASDEIIQFCVEMGGAITGEHGVGMEKDRLMPLLFSEADLEVMRQIHNAFNPTGILNPEKILPTKKGCGEIFSRPLPADAKPA
jgi:glycolate oxidase